MKSVFKKSHAKDFKKVIEQTNKVSKQFDKLKSLVVSLNDKAETVKEESLKKKKGRKKKSSSDE